MRERGFVLVNALVLVLAISAVAAGLLSLAGQGQDRLRAAQLTDQAQLYLDAAEMLVAQTLAADREAGGIDHAGEAWARPILATAIDRGRVDIRVTDLQGRFDLNRLVDARPADRAAFARLLAVLGLRAELLPAIEAYLAPGGPGAAGYADRPEPVRPRGGPLVFTSELRQVDGITEADLRRLSPVVAALPERMPLNVNTAPVEVLQAVLPADGAAVAGFARARDDRPVEDREALRLRLASLLGPGAEAAAADLALGSSQFEAVATARLEERVLARRTAFRRDGDGRTEVRLAEALPGASLGAVGAGE